MLIAALFTISRTWKNPKVPKPTICLRRCGIHTHTMEYYSATIKKEWIIAICSNVDGPRDYIKWSKSDREGQILYDITYMYNVKII